MRPLVVLALMCSVLLAAPSHAAEYFVSTRGKDTAGGSSAAQAFASIQRGIDALKPGDTLTILPGEYFGAARRKELGSANVDTIIRAAIPGSVLMRGDVNAPVFAPVANKPFVFVAEFDGRHEAQAVNELDTLSVLEPAPNVTEISFAPGRFFHDRKAGKLYISTTDWEPAANHRYSVSIVPTHGLTLQQPVRVIIEGLAVTGFTAAREQPNTEESMGSTWGILLTKPRDCVVRDCRVFLNGRGIAINSRVVNAEGFGGNTIERCMAWANDSPFTSGDTGGISLLEASRDTIRESTAFLNGDFGVNIYLGAQKSQMLEHQSKLIGNIVWGNGPADLKIKTGVDGVHVTERTVAMRPTNDIGSVHSLFNAAGSAKGEIPADSIVLSQETNLKPEREFADSQNHDFRLQATSRFRKSAPDGSDRGPWQYQANVFFVSPSGSDEADGLSIEHAWRSVNHAAKKLQPGATLYVEPGVDQGDLDVTVHGEASKPVTIRGRGTQPVILKGALRITGARHVIFERLRFAGDVTVTKSEHVSFSECRFENANTGLSASGTTGLDVRHCVFTGFRSSAITMNQSTQSLLAGNVFDNAGGAAVRVDSLESVQFSDYNRFRNPSNAWMVGESLRTLGDEFAHDQHATVLAGANLDAGIHAARTMTLFVAAQPVQNFADIRRAAPLRLVQVPRVHSLSATTANLEWMTSIPASCQIAWGPTPACEKTATFEVDHFGSYSLTDLKPSTTYYFRIASLSVPADFSEKLDASKIKLDTPPLSFTTPASDAKPRTLYVASAGNDANEGTDAQKPWRTIGHASAQVNVGDTVLIAAGQYPERVRVRVTGAAQAPITFRSMPGHKVTLSGADKLITQAFVVNGKSHLNFDALYFADLGAMPLQGWNHRLSGEFSLYQSSDIRITRCFSDGRNGYTARFVNAMNVPRLVIENSVTMNKMSGSLLLTDCPGFVMEHSVIARPMIAAFVLRNDREQSAVMRHNVFTDMLKKKADLNINLFVSDKRLEGLRMENNAVFVRSFPPDQRLLLKVSSPESLGNHLINLLFANPRFAGDASRDDDARGVDQMMSKDRPLDFNDFFATNPELIKRNIGLQREAFTEFQFKSQ